MATLQISYRRAVLAYHVYLGVLVKTFNNDNNTRGHVFYRWINELPVLALIAIVCLAIVKPDFS